MLENICQSVADMVLEEVTKRFSPALRENKKAAAVLRECCGQMDALASEWGAEACRVEVNEDLSISVNLECPDAVVEQRTGVFYKIAGVAEWVRFSQEKRDGLSVEFVFPGIWERA